MPGYGDYAVESMPLDSNGTVKPMPTYCMITVVYSSCPTIVAVLYSQCLPTETTLLATACLW